MRTSYDLHLNVFMFDLDQAPFFTDFNNASTVVS